MRDKKILLLSVCMTVLSWQHVDAAGGGVRPMTFEELRARMQRVKIAPDDGQAAPPPAPSARRVVRGLAPAAAVPAPAAPIPVADPVPAPAAPPAPGVRKGGALASLLSATAKKPSPAHVVAAPAAPPAPGARKGGALASLLSATAKKPSPAHVVAAPAPAVAEPALFDAALIRDVLIPEFIRLMGPGSALYHEGNYNDVYHYLNVSVQLAERADAIVEYMRGNWDSIVAGRDIPSPEFANRFMNIYGVNFGMYYQTVIETYIRVLQDRLPKPVGLMWPYMPMFESVDYIFGDGMAIQRIPEDLPLGMTEGEYKEMVLGGTKNQLIDGPRLLTRAVRLIQKHPEMAMTLFQSGLTSGGCIPIRNASLQGWLKKNDPDSMNAVNVFANIIKTKLDPDMQLADIVNLYRSEKIKELRKGDVKFRDMTDIEIGRSEELRESYTMTKIATWIREMFRNASQEDYTLGYTLNPGFKPYDPEKDLWDRLKAFEDMMFLGMVDDVPEAPAPAPHYGYGGAAAYRWGAD